MRRGIREMDLILIAFSDQALVSMSDEDLGLYEVLLSENDHDLYLWIGDRSTAPEELVPLLTRIAAMAEGLTRPG
jgi:antitoxin CptB